MPIATGTQLGAYEVQDFIGQGAMGLVYRAYHPELERTGAVKVMQAISPDADTVARFRHEAKAIAQLRHPNIVQVYDFGEYQGTPYMIVEYIAGGSLAARMAHDALDQQTALKYLRGIAGGLDYAHRHGVVHRDVKPANVLLTAEDTPVLADFGLAKLLQGNSLKSMTGVTTGTPAYMAPEQVTGHNVGPAADLYSLATIAYEMLTGAIPFEGEGLMELLYAQVHREPPVPSWRNPALGSRADAVIMQGLAKDPAARWSSASAFVDALESALTRLQPSTIGGTVAMAPPNGTLTASATAVLERTAPAIDDPDVITLAYPSPPPSQPKPRSRRALVASLLAALVVIALIVTAVVVWSSLRTFDLTISPRVVSPGQNIVVTARNLPSDQAGHLEIHSALLSYEFRADSAGSVSDEILLPSDLEPGVHVVKLCWNGACHEQSNLRVIARDLTSPTPIVTPSPTPRATHSPSPSPKSTPTAHPSPTATSTGRPAAVLRAEPAFVPVTGSTTVSGYYFNPHRVVSILFTDDLGKSSAFNNVVATDANGHFSYLLKLPSWTHAGFANIKACDTLYRCASTSITVTST